VKIISAKGLRAADWALRGGSSDPFCTCQVQGKKETLVSTRYLNKTLAPSWEEVHEIDGWEHGEPLEFSVFDFDKGSSADTLGHCLLLASKFQIDGKFDGDLPLDEAGKGIKASIRVEVEVFTPPEPPEPVSVPGSRLKIVVKEAKNLRAADWSIVGSGTSDPFCEVGIKGLPGGHGQLFATNHIDKTLNPVWNETHTVCDYQRGEDLIFTCWDFDKGSAADLLGRATLPCHMFDREGGFNGEVRLKECGFGFSPQLFISVQVLPPERPDVPSVAREGSRLKVTVVSATGLRAADFSFMGAGSSDPYCVAEILGSPDMAFETKYLAKTLSPEWNEDFEMDEYAKGQDLQFTVMDHDKIGEADMLGIIVLRAREFDREGGFSGTLNLRGCGHGHEGKITVKVLILPPMVEEAPPVSMLGSRLKVTVFAAKNLRAADWALGGGKSDPFCAVSLVGRDGREAAKMFETKVINKSLDPIWDEMHEWMDYKRGQDLEFKVFDHDKGSAADLLGRVPLKAHVFDRAGGWDGELRLRGCGRGQNSSLVIAVEILPGREPAEPISIPGSQLQIKIRKASDLRAADWALGGGTSDPYVVCCLKGKQKAMWQTQHINKTLNPEWNETGIITGFVEGDTLELKVFDHDRGTFADILGRVELPGRDFDRDGGYEGSFPLQECGRGHHAYLDAKIEVLPPFLAEAEPVSRAGSRLHVSIESAKHLKSSDGRCDCWAEVEIVDRPDAKVSSRRVGRTRSPVWSENHEISEYNTDEDLLVKVYEQMQGRKPTLLGQGVLEASWFDREGGYLGEVWLRGCGRDSRGNTIRSRVKLKVIVVQPPEEMGTGTVKISGLKVRNLMQPLLGYGNGERLQQLHMSQSAPVDAYITAEVVGWPETRVSTEKIRNDWNPGWTEELELGSCKGEDAIELRLYVQMNATTVDYIGMAKIRASHCEVDKDREKFGLDGELPLHWHLHDGETCPALLSAKVELLHSGESNMEGGYPVAEPGSRLKVQIQGVQGMRGGGPSVNVWAQVQVQERPETSFKTKSLSGIKGAPLMWNEDHQISDYDGGAGLDIIIHGKDRETGKEKPLGTLHMDPRYFDREGGFSGRLRLSEDKGKMHAMLMINVKVLPPSVPEGPPLAEFGSRVRVTLLGARGVQPTLTGALCEGSIRGSPDNLFTSRAAGASDESGEPHQGPLEWNETFELDDYCSGEDLMLKLIAPPLEGYGEGFPLGVARLPGYYFDQEDGFEGEIRVRDTGEPCPSSFIRVKAVVLPTHYAVAPKPIAVPNSRLRITMLGATNLPLASQDPVKNPDPVGSAQIVGNQKSWIFTEAVKDTVTPMWADEHEISGYKPGDSVAFMVFNGEGREEKDVLGYVALAPRYFDCEGGFEGSLRMDPKNKDSVPRVQVRVEVLPPAPRPKPSVSEPGSILSVKFLGASKLRACAGKPDSFCVAQLRGKPDTKCKTKVCRVTRDPVWGEEHNIKEYMPGDRLEFKVMDHDVGLEADILGRATLLARDFDKEGGFEGHIPLRGCRGGESQLEVSVQIVVPERCPLTVNLQRVTDLSVGIGDNAVFCTVTAVCQRARFGAKSDAAKAVGGKVQFQQMMHMDKYVKGDDLVFQLCCGNSVIGQATVNQAEVVKSSTKGDVQNAFSGEVKLTDGAGNKVASLFTVVEQKISWQEREKMERNKKIEEERMKQAKAAAAEKEAREAREAKERTELEAQMKAEAEKRKSYEERMKAAEEADRLEEEALRAREEALATLITVRVLCSPTGDEIASVKVPGRTTVTELAKAAARAAHMLLPPRLVEGAFPDSPELPKSEMIVDLGLGDGSEVWGVICPAVLTSSKDATARLWNAATGDCELVMRGHKGQVNCVDATSDLKWLVTASEDCTTKIWVLDWKAAAIAPAYTLKGHSGPVLFAAFSPNGRAVVTCSEDRTARLWRLRTGECLQLLDGHNEAVVSATFSPDGMTVTTVARDRSAKVWDADNGRCVGREVNFQGGAAVTASLDGKQFLLQGEAKHNLQICGVETEEVQHVLHGHEADILWYCFAAMRMPQALGGTMTATSNQKTRLPAQVTFATGSSLAQSKKATSVPPLSPAN